MRLNDYNLCFVEPKIFNKLIGQILSLLKIESPLLLDLSVL